MEERTETSLMPSGPAAVRLSPRDEPPQGTRRVLLGVFVGAVCAAALYGTLSSGRIPGAIALLIFVALLVFTPVAGSVVRRLALNGALVIGWTPLLWWVKWPVVVNHGAAVLSCWAGALLGMVIAAQNPKLRMRTLWPGMRGADLALVVGPLLALAAMKPWWLVASPGRALEVLLLAWDNAPHFGMFASARSNGAVLGALGKAPDGSEWTYANYPQGFHALVATFSELTVPTVHRGPILLVSYTQMTAVVVALGAMVLTAALLSLPGLRSRPSVAAPAIAFVWAAFLWEPGQKVIGDGFANFWLGAVAASAGLLLALSRRPGRLTDLAAVAGLIVAVSQTWTPLVMIAAPAAIISVRGFRTKMRGPTQRVVTVGICGLSAVVVVRTLVTLVVTVPVRAVIALSGPMHGTSPLPTFVLAVAGPYVFLSYGSWFSRRGVNEPSALMTVERVRRLALVPAIGVSSLAVLLTAQLHSVGTTSYYFLKYLVGFELIMAAVTAGVVAMLVAATTRPATRWVSVAGALAGAMLASQVFGVLPVSRPQIWAHSGLVPVSAPYSRTGIAESLLAVSAAVSDRKSFDRAYVPLGHGGTPQLSLANVWFHALTQSTSLKVLTSSEPLGVFAEPTVDGALPAIRRLLHHNPNVVLVIDPAYVGSVRARLHSPRFQSRVVGW